MSGFRPRLTYANVVSSIALFAVLGGGAYATHTHKITAKDLAKNAVKTKKLANGAVKANKLANGAVRGPKIANGAVGENQLAPGLLDGVQGPQGPQGPPGQQGAQGPQGPAGAPGDLTGPNGTVTIGSATIPALSCELFNFASPSSTNAVNPGDALVVSWDSNPGLAGLPLAQTRKDLVISGHVVSWVAPPNSGSGLAISVCNPTFSAVDLPSDAGHRRIRYQAIRP